MPHQRLGPCVRCGSARNVSLYYCTRTPAQHNPGIARQLAEEVCARCIFHHRLWYATSGIVCFLLALCFSAASTMLFLEGGPPIAWIAVGFPGLLFFVGGCVLIWRHVVHAGSSLVIQHFRRADGHGSPYFYSPAKARKTPTPANGTRQQTAEERSDASSSLPVS